MQAGEALSRAEEPVATNTADGQAFIGSNDEAPFAIFSRSRDLAQARLGDLLATIQDESVSNSVIVTFTQAAILNSALEVTVAIH